MQESLAFRDSKLIWHPYTQYKGADMPVGIVRGKDACIYDESGNKYIDAVSSWWVNIHGHAQPYIADRVYSQLLSLPHVIFAGFTHEPAVALAEQLIRILPRNQNRIFYSDDGSTAVEVAIKMALQYWKNKGEKRTRIIAFDNAYHGDTFGAMSVSARSAFSGAFRDLLFDVVHVPVSPEAFRSAIDDQVALFIYEPLVQGAGGMLMHEPALLDEILSICREFSVVTIADEIMTGFGRTGKLFASDYLINKPDIICLSKGLTGGTMPLAVTSCSESIFDAFLSADKSKTLFHGHSYTANPVACAAAIASLELLLQDSCTDSIAWIGESHLSFIESNTNNPALKNLRSRGTILAMDFHNGEEYSYFNSLRDWLYQFFTGNGVLLRPLGNTVYVMPPYCITESELGTVYKLIELAAHEVHARSFGELL